MNSKTSVVIFLGALMATYLPAVFAQTCTNKRAPSAPTESYTLVEEDGRIVIDNKRGNIWMRCALGQEWDGKSCVGEPKMYTWEEVHQLAEKYNQEKFAGHDHWRVPYLPELATLTEWNCRNPSLNEEVFVGAPAVFFWSAMPWVDLENKRILEGEAYGLDFASGGQRRDKTSALGAVRLMHDGPNGPVWKFPFAIEGIPSMKAPLAGK